MKILLTMLSIILFTTGCANADNAWRNANTYVEEHGYDTPIHVVLGIVGAQITYEMLPADMDVWKKNVISVVVPMVFASVKELTDRNFDARDIADYGGGATLLILYRRSF